MALRDAFVIQEGEVIDFPGPKKQGPEFSDDELTFQSQADGAGAETKEMVQQLVNHVYETSTLEEDEDLIKAVERLAQVVGAKIWWKPSLHPVK